MLLVRRNRENVGTCRSTSSATTAADCSICWLSSTVTLAGVSPSRCSVRLGVTVTSSNSDAGDSIDFHRARLERLLLLRETASEDDQRGPTIWNAVEGKPAVRTGDRLNGSPHRSG